MLRSGGAIACCLFSAACQRWLRLVCGPGSAAKIRRAKVHLQAGKGIRLAATLGGISRAPVQATEANAWNLAGFSLIHGSHRGLSETAKTVRASQFRTVQLEPPHGARGAHNLKEIGVTRHEVSPEPRGRR